MRLVDEWARSPRLEGEVERWCVYNLRGHWGVQTAVYTMDETHPEFACLHKMWFEHFDDAALFKFRWFG